MPVGRKNCAVEALPSAKPSTPVPENVVTWASHAAYIKKKRELCHKTKTTKKSC